MHSLHGNPGARKVTARKKKSPTQKKQGRARRNTQLVAQADLLRALQRNGDENARKLGRIIRGRGDYEIGRNVGGKVGSWLGEKFHKWIKTVTGFGDYEFHGPQDPRHNNSLVANDTTPSFKNEADGALNLIFTEWIGTKRIGPNFDVLTIPLDVSSPLLLPWGYIICRRFGYGDIVGMLFFVASLLADYSATQVVGSCFGAARYDSESSPPTSKRDVMNALFAHTDKASRNQVFAIECRKDQGSTNALKIRQPGMATGDMQFYRMGYFDLCTEGAPQTAEKAFDVSVSYHIKLYKQRLVSGSGFSSFLMDLKGGTQDALAPIANTALVKQPRVNNLNISVDAANSKIFFPFDAEVGAIYLIHVSRNSGGGNARYYMAQNTVFCEFVNIFDNQTSYQNRTTTGATNNASNISIDVAVRILPGGSIAVPPSVVVAGAGPAVDWGVGSLTICQLDPACGSGLQALPPDIYHRDEFLEYLSAQASGDECKVRVPNLSRARLIDFVEEFKREEYVDNNMIERSPARYDVGVVEALGMLSRFIVNSYRGRRPTRFHVAGSDCGFDESRPVASSGPRNVEPGPADEVKSLSDGFDHCLELNGARGEHTGSDDVPGTTFDRAISNHLRQLNPDYSFLYNIPGCTLSVPENSAIIAHREKAAWSRPGSGFVLANGAFMIAKQCLINEHRAYYSAQARRAILRDAARAQCQAFLGNVCRHDFAVCPGAYNLAAANLYHLRHRGRSLLGAFILGANGEATIKDDVFLACEQPCNRRTHHHRKSRDAQAGARRRLTEAKERDRVSPPLYVECRLGVDCPVPTHYHPNSPDDRKFIEGTRQNLAANLVRDSILRTELDELGAADAALEIDSDPPVAVASSTATPEIAPVLDQHAATYTAPLEVLHRGHRETRAILDATPEPPRQPLVSLHEHKDRVETKDQSGREVKQPPARRQRQVRPDRRRSAQTPSTTSQINQVPAQAEVEVADVSVTPSPTPASTPVANHGEVLETPSISSHVAGAEAEWVRRNRVVEWQGNILRVDTAFDYQEHLISVTNDTLQHRRYLIIYQGAAGRDSYEARRTINNATLVRLHIAAQILGFAPVDTVAPLVVAEYPELQAPELKQIEDHYHLDDDPENMGHAPGTYPDNDAFTETCPVCYGTLQFCNIILTTCGHSFCARCVRRTLGEGVLFRCPMCRHAENIRDVIEHSRANAATRLIQINAPPLLPPEPPHGDPSDSSSDDDVGSDDDGDEGDEGDEGDPVFHFWDGEVIPPAPQPPQFVNPRLLMLAGLWRQHQVFREPPPPRNPWEDILTLANQRRARQEYYERMVPIDFYSARPVAHYYQRARTPYPLPEGHVWGVRHRVASGLVLRIESIIAHNGNRGIVVRHVPATGNDAPRAPPFSLRIRGAREVDIVTLYSIVNPNYEHGRGWSLLRTLTRGVPLLHPTDEHYVPDVARGNTPTVEHLVESTHMLGHRWAFWRADHSSRHARAPTTDECAPAIAASLYNGYRPACIYPDLMRWLQSSQDVTLVNLNVRSAASFGDGKFKMREVFVAAVRRCATRFPDHDVLIHNCVDYFDDTIRYYAQQQYFRSVLDHLATGETHGLDFRVGPLSKTQSTIEALSA